MLRPRTPAQWDRGVDQARLHLLRPGTPAQKELQTQFRRHLLLLALRLLQVKRARALQVSLSREAALGVLCLLPA